MALRHDEDRHGFVTCGFNFKRPISKGFAALQANGSCECARDD
jgi:hypothetical protein